MPYAARMLSDEEKKNQAQNISGGAGANFATNVPGQEGDQKSSGQYTNIQSYLDANKDQAAQMGQNVTNKVDESASNAQTKIQSFGAIAPKVEAYDPNDAYKNLTSLSDQQKNQYKDVKSTGGYSGPETIDQVGGYNDVQKSYDEAKTRLQNSTNETGQQQLLRDVYARPQYSGGENKLDQVLLQGNSDSRQALQGLSQKYSGLNDLFKSENDKVSSGIEQSKSQAALNRENLNKAEQDQWKNLIDPIQARANQMNIDNPAFLNRVNDDAADNLLSDETLNALGLSKGQRLLGLNLQSYLNPNLKQLGINDAASAEDRAKFKALNEISGAGRNDLAESADAYSPLSFDRARFDQDLSGADQAFNESARQKMFNTTVDGNQINNGYGGIEGQYTAGINLADFLAQNSGKDLFSGDYRNFTLPEAVNAGYVPSDNTDPYMGGSYLPTVGGGGVTGGIKGGDPIYDNSLQNVQNRAKQDLYSQITQYLNSQNYNRTVQGV